MTTRAATILIASAGRRNYLVRWFREALEAAAPGSKVVVADANADAPARAEASVFERLPSVKHETYIPSLLNICDTHSVDIALSLNDFELSLWARSEQQLDARSTQFLHLSAHTQAIVEDKLELVSLLDAHGLHSPPTVTAASFLANPDILGDAPTVVLKARYGSGSSGLAIVDTAEAEQGILAALPQAHDRTGSSYSSADLAAEALVVQPFIPGQEYGVDIVNDLRGEFQAVLARVKLAMRGGETDRAETTAPAPFRETGAKLSRALAHRGLIDSDVIVDERNRHWVIDINPRFGGGYPFNHIAGADVPLAFVRWLTQRHHGEALEYRPGFRGAKYIEVAGATDDV